MEGTCEWILENDKYQSWLEDGEPLLWFTGAVGKGKTILSAFLTQKHEATTSQINDEHAMFYFCDHEDEYRNKGTGILRSFILQIIESQPQLDKHVIPFFESPERAQETLSALEALWIIFRKLVQDDGFQKTYCVLDGLDVCDSSTLQALVPRLTELLSPGCSLSVATNFRLIVVSREISGNAALHACKRIKLEDHATEVDRDIERFIKANLQRLSGVDGFGEIRKKMETTLLRNAQGTFLWVGFAVIELHQSSTCSEMMKALTQLPSGLYALYSRIIRCLTDSQRQVSLRVLLWVSMAFRPLSLQELATAIRFVFAEDKISKRQAFRDALKPCEAFLNIGKHRVSLIHQSVREYLTRPDSDEDPLLERFRIQSQRANFKLAERCLQCLDMLTEPTVLANCTTSNQPSPANGDVQVHLDDKYLRVIEKAVTVFRSPRGRSLFGRKHRLEGPPLLDYAVEYMPKHATACAELATGLMKKSRPFFKNETIRQFWLELYKQKRSTLDTRLLPSCSLLQVVSYIGIKSWVEAVLDENSHNWFHWRPARRKRHRAVLNEPAPLLLAVQQRHVAVIDLLIRNGADVNSEGIGGMTALHYAVLNGDKETVLLLISKHAKTDIRSATIFERMISNPDSSRLQAPIMIKTPPLSDNDQRTTTPLHLAAVLGKNAIVDLLLDGKADVNAEGSGGRTPVDFALWAEHTTTAVTLQSRGGRPNVEGSPVTYQFFKLPHLPKTSRERFAVDWQIERIESEPSSRSHSSSPRSRRSPSSKSDPSTDSNPSSKSEQWWTVESALRRSPSPIDEGYQTTGPYKTSRKPLMKGFLHKFASERNRELKNGRVL